MTGPRKKKDSLYPVVVAAIRVADAVAAGATLGEITELANAYQALREAAELPSTYHREHEPPC